MSPIQPALSLADLRPTLPELPSHQLPLAAERPLPEPTPSLVPQRKSTSRVGIETVSKAVAVLDWESGELMFEKNADQALPVASLTKLVTALTVLDLQPDWDQEVLIIPEDDRIGDLPVLFPGERVTVRDLFNLSLVSSSNDGTAALARATGLTADEFAARMNQTAAGIGMDNFSFVEPTGLNTENQASAIDITRLVRAALERPEIAETVLSPNYSFVSLNGNRHWVSNTDQLLDSFLTRKPFTFLGGKTGYLYEAGYCFGAAASNEAGNRVVAVVLGAPSKEERFKEVKRLLWWAFDAWEWPAVARN
jgi:D-alanyl-D-alanine carboxypeptidase